MSKESKNTTYCSFGDEREFAHCDTCAFGPLECVFKLYTIDAAEKHVRTRQDQKDKQIKKMKQMLHAYNEGIRPKEEKIQIKEPAPNIINRPEKKQIHPQIDYNEILIGSAVILLLGFPLAYIFPIFSILTNGLFEIFGIMSNSSEPGEVWTTSFKDSFFYSSYWPRYIYSSSLMLCLMVWSYDSKNEQMNQIQWFVTLIFVIVAIANLNLLLSTLLGPLIVIIGLFFTRRR